MLKRSNIRKLASITALRLFGLAIFLGIGSGAFSQSPTPGDSAVIFNFDQFIELVEEHHPVARQAAIAGEKGRAYIIKARGGFDPKLVGEVHQKYFDDKQYYDLLDAGLKVPTWFGITANAGYENNDGYHLNPEHITPGAGLWYAGISIPLGKGLIIDQRRAELKQAKIYAESTQLERRLLLNDLVYQAGLAYWDWFAAYHKVRIYETALENSITRFEAVKQGAFLGDKPFIDTLEAGIQVQNRRFNLEQAKLDYLNKKEYFEVYLWQDGYVPRELMDNASPPERETVLASNVDLEIYQLKDSLVVGHPKIAKATNSIASQRIDMRLNREALKPQVDLKYNALSEPINNDPFAEYSINNYKWSAQVSFPLFLRKERGALQLSDLQLQDMEAGLEFLAAEINYKAEVALNYWRTSYEQIIIYQKTVKDYLTLLKGEQELYDTGESSLFMINSREKSYIEAQMKLVDVIAKNQKAMLKARYELVLLAQ